MIGLHGGRCRGEFADRSWGDSTPPSPGAALCGAQFPDDFRLVQLAVFAWKRRGDIEKAMETAGPLLARSKDDDESAGIVAGVYKQAYLDRGRDPECSPSKSSAAYLGGMGRLVRDPTPISASTPPPARSGSAGPSIRAGLQPR